MEERKIKIKCLINHADAVYMGMVFDVKEVRGSQVRVIGLDGGPVWLSEDYKGVKEFEVIED